MTNEPSAVQVVRSSSSAVTSWKLEHYTRSCRFCLDSALLLLSSVRSFVRLCVHVQLLTTDDCNQFARTRAFFSPLFGPVFVLIFLVNLKFLSFSLSLFANEKLALIAVYPGACLTCVRRVGRWGDESRMFCATAVVV